MRISFMTSSMLLKLTCCLALCVVIFSSIPGTSPAWADDSPQQQGKAGAEPGREALDAKQAGDSYAKNGEIKKAIDAYEQALQAYPAYYEVCYLLGLIYDLQQGDLEKAIACYQKFLELAPNSPDARDVRLLIESAKQALPLSSSNASNASTPANFETAQRATPETSKTPEPAEISETAEISEVAETLAASAISVTAQPSTLQPPSSSPLPPASEETNALAASVPAASEETNARVASVPAASEMVRRSDVVRKEMRPSDVNNIDKIDRKEKVSPAKNIKPASGFPSSEQFISRSIDDKVLKYSIKIAVWQREGYIQKFNELALIRGSSLTSNVSEVRAKLREERQKTTEFINYAKEAEYFLQRQILNDLLKEWGMDLSQLPPKVDLQKAISSCEVLNIQEDKKYVQLSLKAKIDVRNLKEQLLKLGYQFTPTRIQLQCSNRYGESKDRFIEAIKRKSECLKSQSEGIYEIYMPAELFASELSKMIIGTYGIHLDSVDKDKITFTVESKEK